MLFGKGKHLWLKGNENTANENHVPERVGGSNFNLLLLQVILKTAFTSIMECSNKKYFKLPNT